MNLPRVLAALALFVAVSVNVDAASGAHEWTAVDGRKLLASYISQTETHVKVRRESDERLFDIEIARLSDADKAFLRELAPPTIKEFVAFTEQLKPPVFPDPRSDPTKQTNIAGQVFITVKAGYGVKLSSVRVQVFDAKTFSAHENWYLTKVVLPASRWRLAFDDARELLHKMRFAYLTPVAEATTDADGRFSLVHDLSGAFVVVAQATRLVGSEIERYSFAIDSGDCRDITSILLNNEHILPE